MNHKPVNLDAAETAASRFDTVIEWLMIALLAFMPLAFGAVEAWSEMVVIVLAGAMIVCLAAKLVVRRDFRLVWSWTYVPIGLFLALAVLQLVPLPASLVRVVSPATAAQKSGLLGDLPNSESLLGYMPISFYPHATKHDLRLLLAVAAVFFVVVNIYRRADQIKRLLGAVAVIGGGVALLAIAQIISRTSSIYWFVPTGLDVANAGTFINHSNFSQFMNLSIAAALGLLLVKLHESFHGVRVTLSATVERLTTSSARLVWLLAGIFVIGAASVFLSLSRGGAIALLIALSLTSVLIASRRAMDGRGWIMAMMALAAFVCVLYVGFDAVHDRLATISQERQYENRWQIVEDIAVAWTKFPAVGTGLGTHEVVYPMFDRSTSPALAGHAENEYAQAAEETGIIGLGLLVAFGVMVWWSFVRCIRRSRLPIRSAAFGLGFGLLAIMVHSFSDFGQHLPANACLSVVFCGLLVGMARMGQSAAGSTRTANPGPRRNSRPVGVIVLAAIVATWAWSLTGANGARRAETHWNDALRAEERLREKDWFGSNEDYADLLGHAEAASKCDPDNAKHRYWLNVYRWRSISRVRDPKTGDVVLTKQAREYTERIVDKLHQVRVLCPTFGPTYCVVGQLELFVLDRPLVGAEHIRTGFALAPCDPTACFTAGLLDVREGKPESSLEKFQRALALDGSLFREIVDIYVRADQPDLAVTVAGDNVSRLLQVARVLEQTEEHRELAAVARARAESELKIICAKPDAPASAFASMADIRRRERDYSSAIRYYRSALELDYGQVYWRLALARMLAEMEQVAEAIHEARICLRLRPQMEAAKKLIADLSVRPTP